MEQGDVARTGGKTRLPLPQSVVLGLENLGLIALTPPGTPTTGPHYFMHPARPTFIVALVASRIPGDAAVIASWPEVKADRYEPDTLIRVLEGVVRQVTSPTQRAADILDSLGVPRG